MYIYITGFTMLLGGSFVWYKATPQTKSIYFIGIFIITLIAIFRGNVGTDTGSYEQIIASLNPDNIFRQPTEIGFNILSLLIKIITNSNSATLRIISGLYCASVFYIILKSRKNMRLVLITFVIPTTIYIYSINTIRIGLSFNLFIISMMYLEKNNIKKTLLFFAIAISFHASIIFTAPIIVFFKSSIFKKPIYLFVLVTISAIFFILFKNHLVNKIMLYMPSSTSSSLPSTYSGISILITFFFLIPFFLSYPTNKKFKISFIMISILTIFGSFFIAQFSYAGLRLLGLFITSLPILYISISNSKYSILNTNTKSFWSLFLASFISILFTLRNFKDSYTNDFPFIPYSLIF